MKLRFLSMAVAMSVAGVANAAAPSWVEGTTSFNKTFTASGTVLGKEFSQKWEWAVGTGLQGLQGALSQATTTNGNKVTITIPQDTPVLVGKTKEAFSVPVDGGVGAIPNITFTDNGSDVRFMEGPTGYIECDVYAPQGNKIGKARLNLTAAAVASQKDPTKVNADLYSVYAALADGSGKIFYGGLGQQAVNTYLSGGEALGVVARFGGLSLDDIKAQLQANSIVLKASPRINENMAYGDGWKVSASYALGFMANQTIEVTFDANNKPTSTTQWTASLGIQVTYV